MFFEKTSIPFRIEFSLPYSNLNVIMSLKRREPAYLDYCSFSTSVFTFKIKYI